MKAAVKDRPEPGIWVKDMPKPAIAPDEVLLGVKRASICGSDLGLYEFSAAYAGFAKLPTIPGHEFAGEIVEVGSAVRDFKVGDRVASESILSCGACRYCRSGQPNLCLNFKIFGMHVNGGFAELVNVPERHVHRMNDKLSYEEAALIEPSAVACHALLDIAKVEPMDFVTVLGPGPIGMLAGQVARASGCPNILIAGIDVDEKRLSIARGLGFDTMKSTQADVVQKTFELTKGVGADIGIVAAGSGVALNQACELVRKGGKVLSIGIFSKPVELAVTPLVRREVSMLGTFASNWKNYEQAMTLVANGKLDLKPLITHQFEIDQAVPAFETAKAREGCKVQLII